jgi:hypothetical protein
MLHLALLVLGVDPLPSGISIAAFLGMTMLFLVLIATGVVTLIGAFVFAAFTL